MKLCIQENIEGRSEGSKYMSILVTNAFGENNGCSPDMMRHISFGGIRFDQVLRTSPFSTLGRLGALAAVPNRPPCHLARVERVACEGPSRQIVYRGVLNGWVCARSPLSGSFVPELVIGWSPPSGN